MVRVGFAQLFVEASGVTLQLSDESAPAEFVLQDRLGPDGGEAELGAEQIAGLDGGDQILFKSPRGKQAAHERAVRAAGGGAGFDPDAKCVIIDNHRCAAGISAAAARWLRRDPHGPCARRSAAACGRPPRGPKLRWRPGRSSCETPARRRARPGVPRLIGHALHEQFAFDGNIRVAVLRRKVRRRGTGRVFAGGSIAA